MRSSMWKAYLDQMNIVQWRLPRDCYHITEHWTRAALDTTPSFWLVAICCLTMSIEGLVRRQNLGSRQKSWANLNQTAFRPNPMGIWLLTRWRWMLWGSGSRKLEAHVWLANRIPAATGYLLLPVRLAFYRWHIRRRRRRGRGRHGRHQIWTLEKATVYCPSQGVNLGILKSERENLCWIACTRDSFRPDSITGNSIILCAKFPSICPPSIIGVGWPITALYSISYGTGCLTAFKFIIGANYATVNHALTSFFKATIQPRSSLKQNWSSN